MVLGTVTALVKLTKQVSMSTQKNKNIMEKRSIRWGPRKRLEFIEDRLYWSGAVNRRDLVNAFDVSAAQATTDLGAYARLAPENLAYDVRAKTYVRGTGFIPTLTTPSAHVALECMYQSSGGAEARPDSCLDSTPPVDRTRAAVRAIDTDSLRMLLEAVREDRQVRVRYMSRTHPDGEWRSLTPKAFVFATNRWHLRAWCPTRSGFADFHLSRFIAVEQSPDPGQEAKDVSWETFYDLVLEPHPQLSPPQRRIVEHEFSMEGGRMRVPARLAVLPYACIELGLASPLERYQRLWPADPGKLCEHLESEWPDSDLVKTIRGRAAQMAATKT